MEEVLLRLKKNIKKITQESGRFVTKCSEQEFKSRAFNNLPKRIIFLYIFYHFEKCEKNNFI